MEKKFFVINKNAKAYVDYVDAEKAAKQHTIGGRYQEPTEYVIAQAIAYTNTPVPEIEVTKL